MLTLCRDDGKCGRFIVYTLTNVLISQLSVSGGAGGKPVEAELHENRMANHCREIRRRSAGSERQYGDLAMDQIGNDDDASHSGRAYSTGCLVEDNTWWYAQVNVFYSTLARCGRWRRHYRRCSLGVCRNGTKVNVGDQTGSYSLVLP